MAATRAAPGRSLPLLVAAQLIIAVVALAVMAFVAWRLGPLLEEKQRLESAIDGYRSQISGLEAEVRETRRELDETRQALDEARDRLEETADMSRFTFPLDPVAVKSIASRTPTAANALRMILDLRADGVGWHLGGQHPGVGFDSPSFAAFVLRELGALDEAIEPGETLIATSRRLLERLDARGAPRPGDLVFYPSGYALFYFEDRARGPFVVGMTPMGIVALRADFAEPLAVADAGLADGA